MSERLLIAVAIGLVECIAASAMIIGACALLAAAGLATYERITRARRRRKYVDRAIENWYKHFNDGAGA